MESPNGIEPILFRVAAGRHHQMTKDSKTWQEMWESNPPKRGQSASSSRKTNPQQTWCPEQDLHPHLSD